MSTEAFFTFSSTRRRMYAGPIGPYIDDFIALLQTQGYARHSIRCKVRVVSTFSRWLDKHDLALEDATADQVNRFLVYRKRTAGYELGGASALRQMTELLANKHLKIPPPSSIEICERQHAAQDFRQHLLRARGLSPVALNCYQRCVSRFLRERFADGAVRFDQIISADVTDFNLDANLALKETALAKTASITGHMGRFRPDDRILQFLIGL